MAGEWLKFECSLPEKPETLAITIAMGWDDPDLTVGKLMRLFRWFDQQTIDGNAKAVTAALLDRIIGVSGFAAAVSKVGWLIISDDGLALNNFDKHNGHSAKSRSETAKRVSNHRAKKSGQADEAEEGTYQRLCIPRPIRAAVLARDGNSCVYCKRKEGEYGLGETKRDGVLCLDHVIPLTQGGTEDIKNFATACTPCNLFKSDRTPDECGLAWPEVNGERLGNAKPVTSALPREEKRRTTTSLRSVEGAVRATRKCPESFEVTFDLQDWANREAPGVDWKRETDKFRDYTFKTAHSDWPGAWRNWMRRSCESRAAVKAAPQGRHSAAAAAIFDMDPQGVINV